MEERPPTQRNRRLPQLFGASDFLCSLSHIRDLRRGYWRDFRGFGFRDAQCHGFRFSVLLRGFGVQGKNGFGFRDTALGLRVSQTEVL